MILNYGAYVEKGLLRFKLVRCILGGHVTYEDPVEETRDSKVECFGEPNGGTPCWPGHNLLGSAVRIKNSCINSYIRKVILRTCFTNGNPTKYSLVLGQNS